LKNLHFCAHGRVVESINVEKRIPDLNAKLTDEEGKHFKYAAYVSGDFLDENVNTERTDFYISKESDSLFPDNIAMEEIIGATVAQARAYLDDYLKPIVESKVSRINSYVEHQTPQYRAALKYKPEASERIPPNLPDEKLDLELHRINAAINVELKERSHEVLTERTDEITNLPQYIEKYKKLVEEITDYSQARLSQYVIHRKLIIDLLEQSLKFEVDNKDRPDLMVFNSPLAYAEAESSSIFSSIVVVEFKRPMRTEYSETDDNPFGKCVIRD
jgi:hypothetical protein